MQIDPEEQSRNEAEYAAAFEEVDPAMAEMPQEEQPAAGQAAEQPAAEQPAVEAAVDDTAAGGDNAGQTAAEARNDEPNSEAGEVREEGGAAADAGTPDPEPETDIEKERQRLRSWEGRLKAQQAELERKAAAKREDATENEPDEAESPSSESLEAVGEKAAADGNAELGEAAAAAAEAVESGELTPEQAMKQLSEDFGEDFVRMIQAVAGAMAKDAGAKAASEKVGEIGKTVEEIVADISDSKAKAHFRAIGKAHPDFADVGKSEGFRDFVGSLEGQAKADAERVVKTGSAAEIIKLLDSYKEKQKAKTDADLADDPKPAADPVVETQMDAAEGVRSSGMSLPAQPKPSATSYEEAWAEF